MVVYNEPQLKSDSYSEVQTTTLESFETVETKSESEAQVFETAEENTIQMQGELLEAESTETLQLEQPTEEFKAVPPVIALETENLETSSEQTTEEITTQTEENTELAEAPAIENPITENTENSETPEANEEAQVPQAEIASAETTTTNQDNSEEDAGYLLSPLDLLKIVIFIALGIALIVAIVKIASHIYIKKHPEEVQDNSLLENFIFGEVMIVEPENPAK